MFYSNDFVTKNIKEQQMREQIQQAAKDRMLLELQARRPGMLQQLTRILIRQMGHLFLSVGTRLEQMGKPSITPTGVP